MPQALATGRTGEAVHAYEAHGMVQAADTRAQARSDLVDRWDAQRLAEPEQSSIILTHTNAELRDLNLAARERLRGAGELGDDEQVAAERGSRDFAPGDHIMFLKNERKLGVKNGTWGEVQRVSAGSMAVRLDDGRSVAFDLKAYAHVDHGYAATIHKSQGVTVDRVHVLATPGMDRHSACLARLLRLRNRFSRSGRMGRCRARSCAWRDPPTPSFRRRRRSRPFLSIRKSRSSRRDALDTICPGALRNMIAATVRNPDLVRDAAEGRTGHMFAPMAQEARVRADPHLWADRFVERWQGLQVDRDRLYQVGDVAGRERASKAMAGMAKSLERDPQMEAVLRGRARELGLEKGVDRAHDLGRALTRDLGIGRDRGLER